jgi:hypothetical protein
MRRKLLYLPICDHCGREIPTDRMRHWARFCSDGCRAQAEMNRRRCNRARPATRMCEHCGEWFRPCRKHGRFCSGRCKGAAQGVRAGK